MGDGTSKAPVITVIVPVYNTRAYLDECLSSLCGQTFGDIEILCIDDGSSDGSSDLLDDWARRDGRIRVVHQPNGGVSHARNHGMELARGSYLLFVDSDDYIEPQTCEKLVNIARRDDADIVVFGGVTFPAVAWIDACFNTHDVVFHQGGIDPLLHEIGAYPLMCNKLYRRSLVAQSGVTFNERLALGEDNAFQFCVFPHARNVSFTRDTFYHYRCQREGSAMHAASNDPEGRLPKHFALVEYVLDAWRANGWIHGNERDLLNWLTPFLLNDVRLVPFDKRAPFARRYAALLDTYGLRDVIDEPQQDYLGAMARFMAAPVEELPEPRVTVVATPCADVDRMRRGFARLAGQLDQRVELLCVRDDEDPAVERALETLVADDRRARLVASEQEGLAQARGAYVLFARLVDLYQWDMTRVLLDVIRDAKREVDVTCMREEGDILRTHNMERRLHMLTNDGTKAPALRDRTWFAPADVAPEVLSFSSLDAANKLWRTAYAREAGLAPRDPRSVAEALASARTICWTGARFVELGDFRSLTPAQVEGLVTAFAEGMAALRAQLVSRGDFDAHERDYVSALVNGCLSIADRVRDLASERACLAAVRATFERELTGVPFDVSMIDNAYDYDDACRLMDEAGDVDAYLIARHYEGVIRSCRHIRELEDRANGAVALAAGTDRAISDIRNSVSFRVGRVITKAPRLLAKLLHVSRS